MFREYRVWVCYHDGRPDKNVAGFDRIQVARNIRDDANKMFAKTGVSARFYVMVK